MPLNQPELTQQALGILRRGDNFQWYAIPLLALVAYVYYSEIERKNWRAVAAGLALYATHWAFEIGNALIQHFAGHALWTVPGGTSFLILVGVGWELSAMFAIAGVIAVKLLPSDPKRRLLGVNGRLAVAIGNAALFSVIEIFLAGTPAFHWVYPWWGALPVFATVYVPFFLMAVAAHDWPPKTQRLVIGGLAAADAVAMIVFAGILRWI